MVTHTRATLSAFSRSDLARVSAAGVFGLLERWGAVAEERRHLAAADDAVLKDIGVSRADAAREAGRPFWDLPKRR